MISGSIVALVTPMNADGGVDWAALERLLELHIEAGTGAIGAVGTTGESATLSVPEHCEVIKFCVDSVAGRIPIMAGTGANATREAIELTRAAADAGADCCLLVTPYYNRPTQRGLYAHFKAVADAVDVPQILYNVPGRTAVDMDNEVVAELATHRNIVGIKDATGDRERGRDLIARCGDEIAVYSGDDPTAMDLMLAGGKGNISVTANVAPRQMAQLCALAMAGDREGASAINELLTPLNSALFLEANPIPVKWAMAQQGLIGEGIRLPLTVLDEQYHADVRAALEAAGV
ncbi:4-hydroxy-tetrahydrodipicolinate synthase [Halioglobus japonicus]|uniref:4-hydroxy-tetrahydrodipicolinate synthase n=1 Tax=Halioglobus japonicus TaxID=930805 RepID=A0AAP8MGR0_9GAMM|nr:4-hydroxy-tetrahydrodipicolinate synthase [Halioglobus japonicus]PLW87094.1 4-hydroxy-tetrahydrodipicolinate synthase [Halioglobus japonicus]GHD10226.1 4-hydroxy-tetrahydrodipicolinate synthase [Halioglobus japonicus]